VRLRGEVVDAGTGKPSGARLRPRRGRSCTSPVPRRKMARLWSIARSDPNSSRCTRRSRHPFLLTAARQVHDYLERVRSICSESARRDGRFEPWQGDLSSEALDRPGRSGVVLRETHVHRSWRSANVMLAEDLNVTFRWFYWVTEAFRAAEQRSQHDARRRGQAMPWTRRTSLPAQHGIQIFTIDKKPHPWGRLRLNHKSVFEEGVRRLARWRSGRSRRGRCGMDKHNWPW